VLGSSANVRINEWMAAPAHGDDWIELFNADALPVSIGGLWLSDSSAALKNTQVPPLSFIAGKGFADFVADGSTNGGNHLNFKLAAGGDSILIAPSTGITAQHSVTFGASSTEVSRGFLPDGGGSITTFPLTDSRGASNWKESGVVINEALGNSGLLQDYIELRNTGASSVDVSGCWLSDDPFDRRKFVIPGGTIIPAGGVVHFTETAFNGGSGTITPFLLSSLGDDIVFTEISASAETGMRSHVRFGVGPEGLSFGRVLTGGGSWKPEFWPQVTRTPGAANSAAVVTPVIINEVHYHPVDLAGGVDNVRDEFVELHNPTTAPVDLAGWKLKGAGDFIFPPGSTLRAGDYIVVVGFNPATDTASLAAFRAATGIALSVPLYGPFSPKLPNDGGDVEIGQPILPAGTFVNIDKVSYTDYLPWAVAADGTGPSLQRASRTVIGNDPANWAASVATPGAVNTGQSPILDNDGDGIPNTWEDANGLDKFNPADALADNDGDGQSNLAEYLSGTNPNNAADRFIITSVLPVSGGPGYTITFPAKAGKTYTIQYKNALTDPAWSTLVNVAASPADTAIQRTDSTTLAARFYRIVTP
jgi:hypothetical protein